MKVVKLVVARGLSQEQKYGKQWIKRYYVIEAELTEQDNLAASKKKLEAQLNRWLNEDSA